MVARKIAAEKTGLSQLELELSDDVGCRHSVVGRGKSELGLSVCTDAVATKQSADRPIRKKSTEIITDWANRT